ncbi:hypothetical protein [Ideonella alba]|uniref:PBP domain-containing protein n=1 Tax=Ideonella alba TaxID=2824118 RepID=A0A940Y3A9_9BURK|nr:hypothetical protein [Ideonella alba]MBQ0928942.1 hypothetical protein [Ideonella alba]
MNIRLIALAALAAVGTAHATSLSPAQIDAARGVDLKEVRIYGASAQTPALAAYMADICGAMDTYRIGTDHVAYACVTTKDAKTGSQGYAAGTKLLVVKRDAGGSAWGVTPVAAELPEKSLLVNVANCGTGYVPGGSTACLSTATQMAVPHAGISDVEPALHVAPFTVNKVKGVYLNLPAGVDDGGLPWAPPVKVTAMDTAALGQTAFGVAVSPALYAKLQAAQGTTGVPTVGRAQVAAVLAGYVRAAAGYAGWSALTGDVADDAKTVVICRRTAGSGTQAASNAFFLEVGALTDTATGMLEPLTTATAPVNAFDTSIPGVSVYHGSGTGNVLTCLTTNPGSAYALGVVTGERDDSATTWKFVKIDNAEMTNANMRKGLYPFVYTSSMQWNKAENLTIGRDKAMMGFLGHVRANAANVNFLATAPVPRVLALPSHWSNTTESCASATGNNALYGSCVERLDYGSVYNPASFLYGLAASKNYKTNSAAPLRQVR